MKILLTGATGLLGQATLSKLALDHQMTALVRVFPSSPVPGVRYLEIDLSTDFDTAQLPRNIDVVMHLVQSRNFRNFPEFASEVFNTNVQSTLRLLNYARQTYVSKFVFASTGGVYADSSEVLNESSPLRQFSDLNFYFTSKLAAEMLLFNFRHFFEIHILRFFFIYGPGQDPSMLIPRLIGRVRANEAIQMSDSQGFSFNPIFVEDAVEVLRQTLKSRFPMILNVAGRDTVNLLFLTNLIANLFNAVPKLELAASQPNIIADTTKLSQYVDLTEFTSVENGMRYMIGEV